MAEVRLQIQLNSYHTCIEISNKRIIVTCTEMIAIYSLKDYTLINNVQCEDINYESVITPDERLLFVSSDKGLKQYSIPDLTLSVVYQPTSSSNCLVLLKKKNRVLFNDDDKLLGLCLKSFGITEYRDHHITFIFSVTSSSDEEYFFTSGNDNVIKKWSTDTWNVIKSVNIDSTGYTLFVNELSKTLLVGKKSGYLSEFTIKDLSLIRRIHLHDTWIRKIIRLKSGNLITCSDDGYLKFPFSEIQPIQVPVMCIDSITELSDNTVACCSYRGLQTLSNPEKHIRRNVFHITKYSNRKIYSKFNFKSEESFRKFRSNYFL